MAVDRETHTLKPPPRSDFGRSLGFVRNFPVMRDEQGIADDRVTRAVIVEGETVVFRVIERGSVDEPLLECTLFAAKSIAAAGREAALDRVAFFVRIAGELAPIGALGEDAPRCAPVVVD